MNQKHYQIVRLIIAMLIAAFTSLTISMKNYYAAIPVALAGAALLYLLRRRVKGVLADERDYAIAGQASRYTILIMAIIGLIAIFILLDLGRNNPDYQNLGNFLAYLLCSMMLINSAIFKILNSRK